MQNNDLKIYGDKDRLHQVMTNLIENAIKYSPSDTNIYIEATETEKSTTINVKDEGDGIPLKHQKEFLKDFIESIKLVRAMLEEPVLGLQSSNI